MSSFWDTPTKDSQTPPVAKAGGFWDTPTNPFNIPAPSFGMANSTKQTLAPGEFTGMETPFLPRKEPVKVRRAFEATPIETTLPPVVTGLASFGFSLVEAIPRALGTLYGEATGQKTGEADLGFDMRRLGFTDPKYQTAAKEVNDAVNKGENVWQAGLRVMSTKTLDVAFGAQLFSGIAKTLTAKLLAGNLESRVVAQDIVDGYKARQSATFDQLKDAPLKVREKALADLANAKTEAEKVLAEQGAPTTADRARVTASRYTEPLARETPIVGNVFKPTKAEVTSYPSRMVQPNIGMKPVVGGGFWDTPIAGLLGGSRPLGGKAPQPAFGLSIQPVEKVGGETTINILPKEISIQTEAKAVGAKRLAPDRVAHQQLTPQQGIESLVGAQRDLLNKNAQSWTTATEGLKKLVEKYGDVIPARTEANLAKYPGLENDFIKYSSLKKYAHNPRSVADMIAQFEAKAERVKWNAEKETAYRLIVDKEYRDLIKKDISKGYKYPEEVLKYDPSFKKAIDARARYEKGLATSFSADDSRIVFEDMDTVGAGMKRQDGKILTETQKSAIKTGVIDFAEVLGLDMKKLAEDNRWVYVHLNDKNPFLMKNTAGLYRENKGAGSVSISVGGTESFDAVIDGEKVRTKVNTTMAHELGHAIDFKVNKGLFPRELIWTRSKDFKPVEHTSRGDKYWRSSTEVTARMIEQYVSVMKGHPGYFSQEGYWSKDIFEKDIAPAVRQAIDKHFAEYRQTAKIVSKEVAPKGMIRNVTVPQAGTPKPATYTVHRGGELREAAGGEQDFGQGYYFADKLSTAEGYGKTQTYSISLKNPLEVKDRYAMNSVWDKFIATKPAEDVTLRDWLKSQGYDGIVVKDGGMGGEKGVGGFKVVFDKTQITKAPATAKPVSSLPAKLNIRTSNNPTTPYEVATPTAYGEIASYKVFSHSSVDGKYTGVTDFKTGLSVGTSRFKNGKRAIEDVKGQLLAKAKSPEELKKAFEGGHAKNAVINTATKPAPTKSIFPLSRTPQLPEKKVSLPEKGAPKQDIQVPQKSEKGGIVAPVRSEKPLSKAYTPKEQKAIIGIADNFKETTNQTQKRLNTLRKIKDDIVEFVQNKETRVLKLVEQKGAKITDSSDPYLKATLYPGKVDTLIKTGHAEGQAIVNEAKKLATSLKKDLADVRKEVNEFLIARHAPERNLALGDKAAGMSTAEATAKLEAIKKSPQGVEIAKIADKVQTLNNKILDILRDGGVISDELHTTLRTKYKNHIPLNRIFEETDDFAGALSGTGFNVRSTGIKKAVGSQREVSDILGNVLHNYEQAVLRSEKNIVDNATLAFVRANESNLFEVVKPKMVGTDFAGKPLMETTTDPSILQMFENGKKVWIKINDPKLAIALQGVGKEKLGTILNAVGSFTRLYAGLATRFNPEFALPNKIRDLQETMVYLASRSEVGGKGAFKAVTKDPQSMKDVVDFMREKDTPGAKLYAEMRSMGGTTGGFGLSTKAKVEMDIKTMEALANSKTRRVMGNLVEYVDNWNTIFEDSTRLSVYKQALEQGLSKERAAFLAKEASINFNRMGKGGPVVNALYMFSNASIQGSAKMIRAMKNPKVAATVVTVVGVAVAAANEWNDQADPEWRDKVPKWDRLNGLPFVIPSTDGTFRYVTIPVSWGIKPIKVSADFAYDMMSGIDYSAKDVAGTLMTTVLESYNPIGGTDLTSALAPTILDVPFDISRNKSWTGKMIKPDFDKNAPEDIKYFESLKKTATGRGAISLTEMLQQNAGIAISPADVKYAFDSYIGGAGRSITKTGNVLGGLATGKPIPADEYPFISRFYRESQPDETTGKSSEDISALLGQQSRENFKAKQEAISYYDWLKGLPRERANAELDALDIRNPKLADKVTNLLEEDQLGLTYADKQIKQLQVSNGSRAQYIYDKAMKMKTAEERNAYLDDLTNKKIISNTVDEQIGKLISARK